MQKEKKIKKYIINNQNILVQKKIFYVGICKVCDHHRHNMARIMPYNVLLYNFMPRHFNSYIKLHTISLYGTIYDQTAPKIRLNSVFMRPLQAFPQDAFLSRNNYSAEKQSPCLSSKDILLSHQQILMINQTRKEFFKSKSELSTCQFLLGQIHPPQLFVPTAITVITRQHITKHTT